MSEQRYVRFNDSTNRYYHDDQLSAEEREALWYQPKDIASFRVQVKDTIEKFKSRESGRIIGSDDLNEEEYCFRGLERSFSNDSSLVDRHEVRDAFIQAILDIQRKKRLNIPSDCKKLQALASACSRNAHNVARRLAAQDEADVLTIEASQVSVQSNQRRSLAIGLSDIEHDSSSRPMKRPRIPQLGEAA